MQVRNNKVKIIVFTNSKEVLGGKICLLSNKSFNQAMFKSKINVIIYHLKASV